MRKLRAVAFAGVLAAATLVSYYLGFRVYALLILAALAIFGFFLRRPTGRAAKGQACAGCCRTIVYEHEAMFCPECDRPLHASCEREHVIAAHAVRAGGPFR